MNIPITLIPQKNRLTDSEPWILLVEIQADENTVFRFANNNEDVIWNSKSVDVPLIDKTWIAFPMQVGEYNEDSKGELPSFTIQVCNVDLFLMPYLEAYNGFTDCNVTIRLIYAGDLSQPAALEETFTVTKANYDNYWATLTLGTDSPMGKRRPERIYSPNTCPYKFAEIECGYNGDFKKCDKTFTGCFIKERFGADLGIGSSGLWMK